MNHVLKKVINLNGQDIILSPLDIEFTKRRIYLTGEIDGNMATMLNSALRCLARESSEEITLYIESYGGSIAAGFSIYDTIKSLNCNVATVACGMAGSMAAFLLSAAGTKGRRYAQANAEILIHQPLGGARGQATDIRIHAEHILRIREKLNKILAESSGQPIEKIDIDTERDNIMNAEAALAYGLIDIIGEPASEY